MAASAESADSVSAPAQDAESGTAGSSAAAPLLPSVLPAAASDASSRPASPSFSLSSLRREVASLLISAATTAASHCFAVFADDAEEQPEPTIDVERLWEWMQRVRGEAGGHPGAGLSGEGHFPMFDVVKALYALL